MAQFVNTRNLYTLHLTYTAQPNLGKKGTVRVYTAR